MKTCITMVVVSLLGATGLSVADPEVPRALLPESLHWSSPPGHPGVKAAWIVGSQDRSEIYAVRVRLAKGARIPPHTHPDMRFTTVLSGTLYVSFGTDEDEAGVVAVPAGAVYVAPAGQVHRIWARDGDVEYQESGLGPTAVDFVLSGGSPDPVR